MKSSQSSRFFLTELPLLSPISSPSPRRFFPASAGLSPTTPTSRSSSPNILLKRYPNIKLDLVKIKDALKESFEALDLLGTPKAVDIDKLNNPSDKGKLLKEFGDNEYKNKNFVKAIEYYEKSAAQGNVEASYILGKFCREGKHVPKDYSLALVHLRAASDTHADAQCLLGEMFLNGEGTVKRYKTALHNFVRSAQQGNYHAVCQIAKMYENGYHLEKSLDKAFEYYRIAAEEGLDEAQNALGVMFRDGKGCMQDVSGAVEMLSKAAEQGNDKAQTNLASMYANGNNFLEKNYNKAFALYQKAACKNNSTALFNLGLMHYHGQGNIAQDFGKAFDYFSRSSELGNAEAKFCVAQMLESGHGVPRDEFKALDFYQESADSGLDQAKILGNIRLLWKITSILEED